MYVTKHLDWLSVTLPITEVPRSVFPLLPWIFTGKGVHGYAERFIHAASGMVAQTGSAADEMGVHYTLSGDTLAYFRKQYDDQDRYIVHNFTSRHAYASRIDLAINLHGAELTPARMRDELQSRKLVARAQTWRFITGKKGNIQGETLYIGSPSSDRQLRAYNKSAQLGVVNGEAWLRLEMELRQLRANGALQSCNSNGTDGTVSGHVADFISFNNSEFKAAIAGPSVPPMDIQRQVTARRKWLIGQVASALAKEMLEDAEFANAFWQATLHELEQLTSRQK